MPLFEEPFVDPEKLIRDWIVAPGMEVQNGSLTFRPGRDHGFCVGAGEYRALRVDAAEVDA